MIKGKFLLAASDTGRSGRGVSKEGEGAEALHTKEDECLPESPGPGRPTAQHWEGQHPLGRCKGSYRPKGCVKKQVFIHVQRWNEAALKSG
jgi:hypothetical protein